MEKNDRDAVKEDVDRDSSEKLLVLPLGDESKKITQVISNDTAREIMELLAEQPLSASDIAHTLEVPLTTIKYNIENLIDVGLIKIERIKYSEKGRQVKIYAPVRKLIVVVPEKLDNNSITDILKKYLGVIMAAVLATGLIELLTGPYFRFKTAMMAPEEFEAMSPDNVSYARDMVGGAVNETTNKIMENETLPAAISEAVEEGIQTPLPTIDSFGMAQKAAEQGLVLDNGLWFLFGCIFILTIVILVEYYLTRKKRN